MKQMLGNLGIKQNLYFIFSDPPCPKNKRSRATALNEEIKVVTRSMRREKKGYKSTV